MVEVIETAPRPRVRGSLAPLESVIDGVAPERDPPVCRLL